MWRKVMMINDEEQLINLVKNTYENPIIEHNRFGELVVRKNKEVECQFYFRYFDNDNKSACEKFINHNCLALSFFYHERDGYGGSCMHTCDNQDLTDKIIDLIDKHIGLKKKTYEQMSLF